MTSTAAAAVSKKDTRFAPTPAGNQQFFRRERSFVLQRPSQNVPTGNHFQQRERSFIRDGNRSGGGSSSNAFPNSVGSNSGKTRGGSYHNGNNGPAAPASAAAGRGSKPNMEIYRPPSMRSGEVPAGGRGQFPQNSTDHQPPRLTKSRTSLELNNNSTRAANNKVAQQGAPAATVTSITIQKQPVNEATASPAGQFVLQRSKSSGSHLTLQQQKVPVPTPASTNATPKVGNSELPDVSSFPEAAQILLRKIAVDPDGANSRSVMEAVKTLFNRVIESSRYASSIARYCSYVIEKETKETFRESLLNTCQESFQERDRILRSAGESSQRWVAFINFLNEMYLQLKRRNFNSKIKTSSTRPSPDLILLSLLAESCCATLRQPSSQSLQELECLFFVLTGIGRDVETELPTKMFAIWNAIRDAFLEMNALPGAAQRTLLQLVELRAAKWQLPATAVTYYYPSVSGSAY
ncbi:polyadenylate-binding protein-interacting protein 1-like isoform X1 [Daphnia pulex]|uniref:polyadenylate-binding protein-interacting protein 1-like isoform X1 n=1 Tax=Daphnia pulex TaxID=6669 RepID=UPI001EE07640|nr:polyadenylate-binding protein-interacting protein 1-like isoform X1 [Daphnia pulex]XP_046647575.1 polyadenylate-binding protein-interacting protein 1-like isoform X1 [Daphnia pulicaria]XP_046647576.1 polyadenylate-binding protein-interacting protein 1-like isoform X1 [Daphnia pulicaria]